MELRQLKAFHTVAREMSFTRAAELMGYAQSSVTAQVRSLEDELGIKLFERLGRSITLTREGERLLLYAEKILKLAAEAKEAVSDSSSMKGTLSIGAVESLCVYRLPNLLQEYRKRCPHVEIILKIGTCTDFLHWLKDDTIDIAFSLDIPSNLSNLVSETLLVEPMVIVSGTDHPLRKKLRVSPSDLEGECLILTEKGCTYRSIFENILAESGVQPGTVLEFGSVEAIKQCVISGIGIALLPRIAVDKELTLGQLVHLSWDGPGLDISMQLLYHKDKWISPSLRAIQCLSRELYTAIEGK